MIIDIGNKPNYMADIFAINNCGLKTLFNLYNESIDEEDYHLINYLIIHKPDLEMLL